MPNYRLTNAAENDLNDILEYGEEHFGIQTAVSFYEGLLCVFTKLVENPTQFVSIDEVRQGYRRAVYKTYSIYFIERQDFIEITRVIRKYPVSLD